MKRAIIFDAGTIISFAMNGMFEEFRKLKKIFRGDFLITNYVKDEIIDKPINRKKFEFEAMRIKKLLDDGIFKMPVDVGVDVKKMNDLTSELTEIANSCFRANGDYVHAVDYGETSCLALSRILTDKGIDNIIATDERTVRLMVEKPENMKKFLGKKLHSKITLDKKNLDKLKGFRFIRSSELAYILHKKGLIDIKDEKVLEAMLYAMKFKGCAISFEEIDEIKRVG